MLYLTVDRVAILPVPIILRNIARGNSSRLTGKPNNNPIHSVSKPRSNKIQVMPGEKIPNEMFLVIMVGEPQ
jgi:hypothetical protein